jgi:hypothetical protein
LEVVVGLSPVENMVREELKDLPLESTVLARNLDKNSRKHTGNSSTEKMVDR